VIDLMTLIAESKRHLEKYFVSSLILFVIAN